MASPTTQMKLPTARAAQIRALARARRLNITETIEFLLNLAIQDDEIPDVLPGYEIVLEDGLVVLSLEGTRIPGLNRGLACTVADNLVHAGTQQAVGKCQLRFYGPNGGVDEIGYMLIVGRHGAGVIVALDQFGDDGKPVEGARISASMTCGMAIDLARQIRAVAQMH